MELGTPPLYAEANRVSREVDKRYLKELGPYIKALSEISFVSERNKVDSDKLQTGLEIKNSVSDNIGGSFLLWRGAKMKEEWIIPYIDEVGADAVYLSGSQSCSRSPFVALSFAIDEIEHDKIPVLFVISCKNYIAPEGITMDNEAYSAYPSEGEVLLCEGCLIKVLAVE